MIFSLFISSSFLLYLSSFFYFAPFALSNSIITVYSYGSSTCVSTISTVSFCLCSSQIRYSSWKDFDVLFFFLPFNFFLSLSSFSSSYNFSNFWCIISVLNLLLLSVHLGLIWRLYMVGSKSDVVNNFSPSSFSPPPLTPHHRQLENRFVNS